MSPNRLPGRDPRTVARDIPGILNVLFPRIAGGLVNTLNEKMFSFPGIRPVPSGALESSHLPKAMLFELSMARAESKLRDGNAASWEDCATVAARRQQRHFNAHVPTMFTASDLSLADHAAQNLIAMLTSVMGQRSSARLEISPPIPGMGWVASGNGDFAIGSTLIEVKHSEGNFNVGDLRQVLMYWLLRYAKTIETIEPIWSHVLFLNPRRNAALFLDYNDVFEMASGTLNRVDLLELLRSLVTRESDRG